MSDLGPSVWVLEEAASGTGVPLQKAVAGDLASARNQIGVLPAIDVSGALQYIPLDASGNVKVAPQGATTYSYLQNANDLAATSGMQTVATVTLATSTQYDSYDMDVASTRDCYFELCWNNNGSIVVLGKAITLAGAPTFGKKWEAGFTSGSGTQALFIRGKQLNSFSALSDLHAVVTVRTP